MRKFFYSFTFLKNLFFRYKVVVKKLKELLGKVEFLALTSDLWKNKKLEYFLALTAHFFDKGLNFRSIIISFRKFRERHFARNISEFITRELDRYLIVDKCVSLTTDNEATVRRAAKDLNPVNIEDLSCLAHNLNLSVNEAFGLWKRFVKYIIPRVIYKYIIPRLINIECHLSYRKFKFMKIQYLY